MVSAAPCRTLTVTEGIRTWQTSFDAPDGIRLYSGRVPQFYSATRRSFVPAFTHEQDATQDVDESRRRGKGRTV